MSLPDWVATWLQAQDEELLYTPQAYGRSEDPLPPDRPSWDRLSLEPMSRARWPGTKDEVAWPAPRAQTDDEHERRSPYD